MLGDREGVCQPDHPEFPSVTPRVPAAVWGEREIRDMYGLRPVGLLDERRPRCRMTGRMISIRCAKTPWITVSARTDHRYRNLRVYQRQQKDARVVIICPHITSDERVTSVCLLTGERIVDADHRMSLRPPRYGKLAETRMGYNEVTFLSDRVCGICGFTHSAAYTHFGGKRPIYVPQRAHYPQRTAGSGASAQPPAEYRSRQPLYRL